MARAASRQGYAPDFLALVAEVERDLDAYRPTKEQLRADLDSLTHRISAKWPAGLTAEEVIRRQRGPLP